MRGGYHRPMASMVLEIDQAHLADVCRRFGVVELALFGSYAHGTPREDSDVDLLYVLDPAARLGWGMDDLARDLESVLGQRVDLVSKRALHPLMAERVLAEAQVIYAA